MIPETNFYAWIIDLPSFLGSLDIVIKLLTRGFLMKNHVHEDSHHIHVLISIVYINIVI